MHKRERLAVLLFFLGLVPFAIAFAQPCQVAGEFRPGQPHDKVNLNFHCDALGKTPDEIHVDATLQHEMIHAFKAQGILDEDVPFAAAMGYYIEWVRRGRLLDDTKIPFFKAGLAGSTNEVEGLILKYRRRSEKEPLESYEEGAKLAGIIFKQYGKETAKVRIYILALGMGVDHEFATQIVMRPEIAKIIVSLRFGKYFLFDNEKLDCDLNVLDPASKANMERYIKSVNERYKIGLIPSRDVVLGGFAK